MSDLAGRTVLVTGAGKRIGRAVVLGFAAEGAHCLVHYHLSELHAAEVVQECRALGVRAEALRADLRRTDEIEALARAAVDRGAEILVYNASTFTRLPFLENEPAAHAAMLARDWELHVAAPYLLSRILGEHMVERGFGRIVLFGDWSTGAAVYRHYAPYIVSKAAVPTLAKVLALELGSRCPAITVNAVLPGPTIPPEGHDPEDYEMVRRQTVSGAWVGPEEIVRATLFFAKSEKITGTALAVDGGRAIKAL
ncbi:MAG: SDR family NAD(P)-dependent oxidoreductase [Candidatus Binatia bacterium]